MRQLAFMAAAGMVLVWAGCAQGQTVDDVLKNMSAKAETIKDLNVSANVTKYDSTFEKKTQMRLELWYKNSGMTRVDTFKKMPNGTEVQTQLVVIGTNYVLRATPEDKKAEKRMIPADEMKAARENRNDPMTFFTRKPEDVKKDFDVQLAPTTKPNCVKLVLKPKNPKTMEYKAVELTIDKATWLPCIVRTMSGGEDDDWAQYEFTKVLLNTYFPDVIFADPPGYQVSIVAKDAPDSGKK